MIRSILPLAGIGVVIGGAAARAQDGVTGYDLGTLWNQGDAVTHITLAILVIMSLASWSILLIKLWDQFQVLRHVRQAEQSFWSRTVTEEGLAILGAASPCRVIAQAGIDAARHHGQAGLDGIDLHTWVSLAIRRAWSQVAASGSGGLPVLATIASTAPFVGLFGTVWGIQHALAAIGRTGQASLDKVAGPVGEALIMTAIGLAVAVPAVLGYNLLARRDKVVAGALREFADDLHALLVGGKRRHSGGKG
ncbi:MAG: MotA/TolQ/ExbB proton channel family protein [Magnetospirillum sp.]